MLRYFDKFRSDIKIWVIDPLSGTTKPEWIAQFADVNAVPYWFTNLLWWGLGPALEIWALAGVVWLLVRRDRLSLLAAAFPIVYWLSAGRTATIAPFIRYTVPLAPPLAIAAGALCADLIAKPRWRTAGIVTTAVVIGTTTLWAVAYMNVFRQPDSRLAASQWLLQNVPAGSKILIEPSHNIPPMGSYLTNVNFHDELRAVLPADREARLLPAVRARHVSQPVQPRRRRRLPAQLHPVAARARRLDRDGRHVPAAVPASARNPITRSSSSTTGICSPGGSGSSW